MSGQQRPNERGATIGSAHVTSGGATFNATQIGASQPIHMQAPSRQGMQPQGSTHAPPMTAPTPTEEVGLTSYTATLNLEATTPAARTNLF